MRVRATIIVQAAVSASLLAALFMLPVSGCGSASTNVVGPSVSKCQMTVAPPGAPLPADGGAGTIGISADRECSWTAASDSAWLAFTSPANGQGDARLSFSVSPNPAASARSAGVVVNDQHVQVSQAGAPCRFQLDRTSETVPASGGSGTINVSTIAGCSWSASADVSWVTLQSASGSGTGRVGFTAASNTGPARAATLAIAGVTFTLQQASGVIDPPPGPPPAPAPPPPPTPAPPPAPEPPPQPCEYTVSPIRGAVTASGGSLTVRVATGPGCAWTAASQSDWLTVSGARPSGSGDGTITVTAAANGSAASRTGTALVAGRLFTLTQDGLPTVQLEGEVSRVSGRCPSVTFRLAAQSDLTPSADGTTVTTNGDTRFTGGGCDEVKNGATTRVTGVQRPDGRIEATIVHIQKKAEP